MTSHKELQETIKSLNSKLVERNKEITCLYKIFRLDELELSFQELLDKTVEFLQEAFQYPELTEVRIQFDERQFQSEHFDSRFESITAVSKREQNQFLELEVCYRNKDGEKPDVKFLKEEQVMINAVADLLCLKLHHKKMHNDLQESLQRYELITKATSDAVWDYDPKTDVLLWGEGFKTLFGYSSDDRTGFARWFEKIHPNDKKRIEEKVKLFMSGSIDRWDEEYQFKKADGSYSYVHDKAITVNNDLGELVRVIGAMEDITGRKIREFKERMAADISNVFNVSDNTSQALAKTLNCFNDLKLFALAEFWMVDNKKESIVLAAHLEDSDDKKLFYKKSEQFKSYKKGEGMPGKTWQKKKELYWNNLDKRKTFIRSEAAALAGIKTAFSFPVIYDDEILGVLLMGVKEDIKEESYYLSLFRELSVQIAHEVSRKKLEDELKLIFESAPDIICIAGLDGYYKKVNPAMVELYEYSEEELLKKPIMDFVHPLDRKRTMDEFEALNKGEGSEYFENRHITKSGKVFWISWTTKLLYNEGITFSVGRNVTKQKELEELLNQANRMARIGSWELDLTTKKIYWTEVTREIHETAPDYEPILKDGINFYKEGEHRETITMAVKHAIEQGTPWDLELQIITAKGNERWVRTIGDAEFVNGKCVRLYGSFQDIHDKKTAEEKLRTKSEHINAISKLNGALLDYQNWYDSLNNHLEVIGKAVQADRVYYFENKFDRKSGQGFTTQKLEWCREGVEPQLGNPELDDIPLKEIPELVAPMIDRQPAMKKLSEVPAGSMAEHVMKTQHIKAFLTIPIYIDEKFHGFVGFDNCTEEKEWSEEELKTLKTIASNVTTAIEREREQKLILEKSRQLDAIAQFNGLLISEDTWFEALQRSFEMFGNIVGADRVYYFENRFDAKGEPATTTMKWEWTRDGFEPQLNNPEHVDLPLNVNHPSIDIMAQNRPYITIVDDIENETFKNLLKEQGIKSVLSLPVFVSSKFHGFIGFDDCTTERIWNEDEIGFLKTICLNLAAAIENENAERELEQQARELAISNAELEQFAFVASHDLQEPLRMITSFLSQLERKYHDVIDDRGKQYIHFATDGAKRMRKIILDLLEYSRVGREEIEREHIDISDLLEGVVRLFNRKIRDTDAVVKWDNMPEITASRGPVQQLFHNLIGNGLKYQPEGNKPEVVIEADETETHWKFSVIDNGIGINPDYQEKIFNIFQRLHNREKYDGSGVGLAICKKIVEEHGGEIWVESEEGKGSTFYFTIAKNQKGGVDL